jgi:hypothetical protein
MQEMERDAYIKLVEKTPVYQTKGRYFHPGKGRTKSPKAYVRMFVEVNTEYGATLSEMRDILEDLLIMYMHMDVWKTKSKNVRDTISEVMEEFDLVKSEIETKTREEEAKEEIRMQLRRANRMRRAARSMERTQILPSVDLAPHMAPMMYDGGIVEETETEGAVVKNDGGRYTGVPSYRVEGYLYEADYHCIECAIERFGSEEALDQPFEKQPTDNEGNTVVPLFVSDLADLDYTVACGTCGDTIADYLMNDGGTITKYPFFGDQMVEIIERRQKNKEIAKNLKLPIIAVIPILCEITEENDNTEHLTDDGSTPECPYCLRDIFECINDGHSNGSCIDEDEDDHAYCSFDGGVIEEESETQVHEKCDDCPHACENHTEYCEHYTEPETLPKFHCDGPDCSSSVTDRKEFLLLNRFCDPLCAKEWYENNEPKNLVECRMCGDTQHPDVSSALGSPSQDCCHEGCYDAYMAEFTVCYECQDLIHESELKDAYYYDKGSKNSDKLLLCKQDCFESYAVDNWEYYKCESCSAVLPVDELTIFANKRFICSICKTTNKDIGPTINDVGSYPRLETHFANLTIMALKGEREKVLVTFGSECPVKKVYKQLLLHLKKNGFSARFISVYDDLIESFGATHEWRKWVQDFKHHYLALKAKFQI